MEKKIDEFIERLSDEQVGNLVENIYENEAQRENLRLYLNCCVKISPPICWWVKRPDTKDAE